MTGDLGFGSRSDQPTCSSCGHNVVDHSATTGRCWRPAKHPAGMTVGEAVDADDWCRCQNTELVGSRRKELLRG